MTAGAWGACLGCGARLDTLDAPCPTCGSPAQLQLHLPDTRLLSGQPNPGVVRVLPAPGLRLRSLEVQLRWGVFGSQPRTDHRALALALPLALPDAQTPADIPFTLTPPWEPGTYAGEHLSVHWAAGVRAERADGTVVSVMDAVTLQAGPAPLDAVSQAERRAQHWRVYRRDEALRTGALRLVGGGLFGLIGALGLLGALAGLVQGLRGAELRWGMVLFGLALGGTGLSVAFFTLLEPLVARARALGLRIERGPESVAQGQAVSWWVRSARSRPLRWELGWDELHTEVTTRRVRGNDQIHHTHRVARRVFARGELPAEGGIVSATLPTTGPATVDIEHRRVDWTLRVSEGEGWREVQRDHPFLVLPWSVGR